MDKKLEEIWNKYDSTGDGTLDKEEARRFFDEQLKDWYIIKDKIPTDDLIDIIFDSLD